MVNSICKELSIQKEYIGNETIDTIYFGGGTPTKSAITEEWNVPSNTVKTLTD